MIEFPRRRRIYLMRHAEAAYVSPEGVVTDDPRNVPLTSQGREQAHTQGGVLKNIRFDRVICSGLPRTVETANIVLAQSDTRWPALEHIPELEEIHGLKGDRQWPPPDGSSVAEVLSDIANPWAKGALPGATFLGGEAFTSFAERVVRNWEHIISDDSWDTTLMVLHGAVNRMIFNHATGLNWRADLCFEQDNGCINIIDIDETQPRRYLIRAVNVTAYNLSKEGIVLTNMESTAQRVAETLSAAN